MEPPEALWVYDRWLDSGLAFLTLCTGDFDGFILHIKSHREWDLAAPALMVQEAGGRVTDEDGKEVIFGEGSISYKYLVASNTVLHEDLLRLIPR
jgi:3'-phosphoadenosine 5'-phosphosulfate (PAPS) 3'-phosphatase